MSYTVTGSAALKKKMERFSADLQRSVESVLKQEARAACVSLCFHTLPYGFGPPTQKKMGRIQAEIRKVYAANGQGNISAVTELIKPRSRKLAMAYRHYANKGDFIKANKYLREAGFTVGAVKRELHRASRTGPQGSVAKNNTPQDIVRADSRDKYTLEKQGTVGTAKAGWAAAAKAIGGRVRRNDKDEFGNRSTAETIPEFVRKLTVKFKGLGGARVLFRRVEVFTNVTYADEALPQGALESAIDAANTSFQAAMAKSLTALIKKHRLAA